MTTVKMKSQQGAEAGAIDLPDAIFGVEISEVSVRQALTAYLAAQRRGTAKAKTRGEVSGGGSKPWRQKGTGRARQGSIRSPLWRHGAVIFGPMPRSYDMKINRKVRRRAIQSALTARAQEGAVTVLESLALNEIKTRQVAGILGGLGLTGRILILTGQPDVNLALSARNIANVSVSVPENLNIYDLLQHDHLVLTKDALERVAEMYA